MIIIIIIIILFLFLRYGPINILLFNIKKEILKQDYV
jgi:hypothetical protein